MGFALDHADASADVVGVLKESLLVPETPIHGERVSPALSLCLSATLMKTCKWCRTCFVCTYDVIYDGSSEFAD